MGNSELPPWAEPFDSRLRDLVPCVLSERPCLTTPPLMKEQWPPGGLLHLCRPAGSQHFLLSHCIGTHDLPHHRAITT